MYCIMLLIWGSGSTQKPASMFRFEGTTSFLCTTAYHYYWFGRSPHMLRESGDEHISMRFVCHVVIFASCGSRAQAVSTLLPAQSGLSGVLKLPYVPHLYLFEAVLHTCSICISRHGAAHNIIQRSCRLVGPCLRVIRLHTRVEEFWFNIYMVVKFQMQICNNMLHAAYKFIHFAKVALRSLFSVARRFAIPEIMPATVSVCLVLWKSGCQHDRVQSYINYPMLTTI